MPPAKYAYLHFLADGLTLDGHVWRAGAVCATEKVALGGLTDAQQQSRWGKVMFRKLTKAEYDKLAKKPVTRGPVVPEQKPAAQMTGLQPPAGPPEVQVGPWMPLSTEESLPPEITDSAAPFSDYPTLDLSETLEMVATMTDSQIETFLDYERSHLNRPDLIKAIVSGELPE